MKFHQYFSRRLFSYQKIPSVDPSKISKYDIAKYKRILPPLVQKHLAELSRDIKNALDQPKNEKLQKYSDYCLSEGGKLIRPTVVLLMAGCCDSLDMHNNKSINITENRKISSQKLPNNPEISESQKTMAIVSEMIHTASLVHDDVIDQANQRRGRPTLSSLVGNKSAILLGDYILAKAVQLLTIDGDSEVISLFAQVIDDLVRGEFMQLGSRATEDERFTHYMSKTFKKTASLFAHSCQAVAQSAGCTKLIKGHAFEYGKNLGLAFQLIDDTLDFVSINEKIGKPTFVDLKLGLATAPVLFASRQHPELNEMILRRFSQAGDVDLAYNLILESDGIMRTKQLANQYSRNALEALKPFPDTPYKEALRYIALAQSSRDR